MELILSLPCYSHGQPLTKWVFPTMGILRYTKDEHWTTKNWLVVWNIFYFPFPLTFIFFRGIETTNQPDYY